MSWLWACNLSILVAYETSAVTMCDDECVQAQSDYGSQILWSARKWLLEPMDRPSRQASRQVLATLNSSMMPLWEIVVNPTDSLAYSAFVCNLTTRVP